MNLAACTDWPPGEDRATRHFNQHRDSFDRLAEKIRGTDYWRVSLASSESEVRVWPDRDGGYDSYFLDDDPEWHALLSDIGMYQVVQDDGAVSTGSGHLWYRGGLLWKIPDNRFGFSDFTQDPNLLDRVVACAPEHEAIACGGCAVALSDGWYQEHAWWPEYFDEERWDAYLNGDMDQEDYNRLADEDRRRCMIDGYAEMGYDVERVFDLDTAG